MLEQLEALRALHETGTTGRAALRLRLTQSAVSKRVAALEATLGVPLVEKHGRGVRLTPAGVRALDEVAPLLLALHERVRGLTRSEEVVVRIAATESLLASWLPACLAAAAPTAGVRLELHAHRGPVALDRVRSGQVDLAVCVGGGDERGEELGREPMVIVRSAGGEGLVADGEVVRVWTIEEGSLTGAWLARRLPRWRGPFRVEPVARIESFGSAIQLARAGFGHALVPVGLARSFGVPAEAMVALPGLARPLVVAGAAGAWERAPVRALVAALRAEVGRRLS